MFANTKTFNALPQHEKPREKTIRGFNKKVMRGAITPPPAA